MTILGVIKFLATVACLIAGVTVQDEQKGRFIIGIACIFNASIWLFSN